LANRNVKVTLSAEVGQYEASMRKAEASTKQLGATATDAGSKSEQASRKSAQASAEHAANVEKTSKMLAGFGTVAVAGMGMAAKAAIGWEADWTGVMKTVDGTPEQLQAVEDGLRGLTKELPASHTEIAAVAQAAGQLGIATPNVVSFTKTMIDMGESTNLSAEEAATTLARFSNVMGTSTSDVGRLGATIVGLGNNFATTESEIAAMAQRLSGAGAQAGLTEADVLGISAAMSSVGIEAEAGGTAMSLTMKRIGKAVDEGGDKLELFASVAGMSTEEFAAAWRDDAGAALTTFVGGLGQAGAEGESLNAILSELGITGIRESDALLRLAASGDLMGNSMTQAGEEWEAGTALVEEAAKRYETTEAQISMAWNAIKDAAISAGAVMLPVIAGVADSASDLASAFSDLPAPVQAALTSITGLVGAASLVAGGFFLMLPKVQESRAALASLGPAGARANTVLGKVGKAAGVATVALTALAVAGQISDSFVADNKSVSEFAQALLLASEEGENMKDVFSDGNLFASSNDFALTAGGIDTVGDALSRVNNRGPWTTFRDGVNEMFSGLASSEIVETKQSLEAMDSAITSFADSGALDQAATSFRGAVAEGKAFGVSMETTAQSFPQYLDHLRGLAQEQDYALGSTEGLTAEQELLNWAMGEAPAPIRAAAEAAEDAASRQGQLETALGDVGLAADGAVESLTDYLESLFAAGLATQSVMQAQSSYQQSLDGVGDALDQMRESEEDMGNVLNKSKGAFDVTSDAGRLAQDTFIGIADAGRGMATAMAEAGESQDSIQGSLKTTYSDLIDAGEQFGLTGEQAKTLARDVLGIPEGVSIDSWMAESALETAANTKAELFQLPEGVDIGSFMSDEAYRMAQLTKGGLDDLPNSKEISSWMSDDAFATALMTRAAVLGIPARDVVSSFMSSAAKDTADATTARVLGIPDGASVSSFMSSNARVEAWQTKAAVDAIPSTKRITITTIRNFTQGTLNGSSSPAPTWGNANGGRLPKHASGGRLPLTGPGTDTQDGILGVSSLTGMPTSFVDKGEWIINSRMSERYNAELAAMNAGIFPKVPGYAGGGRAGRQYDARSFASPAPPISAEAIAEVLRVGAPAGKSITLNSYNARASKESEILREALDYNSLYERRESRLEGNRREFRE